MHHYVNIPIRTIEDVEEFAQATASFQGNLAQESYSLRDDSGELHTVNREGFIQRIHQIQQDPNAPEQEAWAEVCFSGGVAREMHCDLDRLTEQGETPSGEEMPSGQKTPRGKEAQPMEELPF